MSKLSEVVFFDAKRVNDKYDFVASAKRVIDSHWYILGNEVNKFESEFSDYLSSKHCISLGKVRISRSFLPKLTR
ncbi:DegT/DnrJ/EryC1/StrS family aminotransferase [Yersinia enterocolitica]|nr:DegT/DnrJ/EryC1/StrS family aminotransferase [Yersinia enterocolitica]EKN4145342.1 DegT/DnrJ/EryC1/StrS family aminotransferase [Yersinia enterocolitica]EMC5228737.1 DegT/DnrJ/EryC1/StrS family aminotransferase [Yersinia enterocolitica]HDL7331489.1 DegT/DnrJ/EryC1/StrS family aminotransferase [Yersinia enterocolitica]HEB5830097.1 DegT/DnrJ/EryC1/StrS family aminotransferase [Yersinia enterocolitica]